MTNTKLISTETKFTFMLSEDDRMKKQMAELSIFNDGSVFCRKFVRTPAEDKDAYRFTYPSITEALEGDILTHYLLRLSISQNRIDVRYL